MLCKHLRSISICLMLLALVILSPAIAASDANEPQELSKVSVQEEEVVVDPDRPLKPLDLSSPRAALDSFLMLSDFAMQMRREQYWDKVSREGVAHTREITLKLSQIMDLSKIPPASRSEVSRDAIVYLYEVLSRIELPPEEEIPDAEYFADKDNSKKAGQEFVNWTIPDTDITFVRVSDGPDAGKFKFSSSTAANAKEFYKRIRTLPYRRDVPLKNYAEMRRYMAFGSWMIAPKTIEGFPGWMKIIVLDQALWKWIAFVLLLVISVFLVMFIHRLAQSGIYGHTPSVYLRHLLTPVTIFILTKIFVNVASFQLTLTGWLLRSAILVDEAIIYFSLAWIVWSGSMLIAESIILSPKIKDQSLNAHLLRLVARALSLAVIIGGIFHLSSQLGAPLYGLITGLGIGGIAVALAAQPTIENFIGSLNLFADHPVRVGQFCRYGEDPNSDWLRIGTVESIGIRSTRIRGIDDTVTTIPNADFCKMHIVNYTARRRLLLMTVLQLRYETTDEQMRFVLASLREMLLAHPKVADEEPRVRFVAFGEYSLDLEVRVFIGTRDYDVFKAIREDIYLRFMKIVKDAGTGFAFPSRTVYSAKDDGLDAECQQKAEEQVEDWRSAKELPFPDFSDSHREKNSNTLDYPPKGSSEGSA